jgi:uncharacterized protein (DUF433 family)
MPARDYLHRIEVNPKILLGKPVIKGTRIPVYVILDLIAERCTIEEILEYYPSLKEEDVIAALQFGAEAARCRELEFVEATG